MLLLVEDEVLTLDWLENELAEAGYEVVTAHNAMQAIAELDADAGRFRAVITDINLGAGPDGWAVGCHSRLLVPAMPVVYMTGASAHQWVAKGVPGSVLVAKPGVLPMLTATLAALLAGPGARQGFGKPHPT